MEKIKNYIKSNVWIDIALIIFLIIVFSLLFATHISVPMTDRGRELFLPEQILNGAVPYKDITLIYFPLAYYINALIYKILGVSINSLVISQTIFCMIFTTGFYFLSRDFINRRLSFILSIFIIFACIYSPFDIYSYISPYSYAVTYGIFGFFTVLYFLIKLYKTNNIKYAYIASFAAGFSFSCKLEFFVAPLLLITGLILYKKLKFKQYIMILFAFCTIPLILTGILHIQGVTLKNIVEAVKFAGKFSTTPVMTEFLSGLGLYPSGMALKSQFIFVGTVEFLKIVIITYIAFWLNQKYKKPYILVLGIVLILYFLHTKYQILYVAKYWTGLPILTLILFCVLFKKIIKEKPLAILVIASILLSQRVFFFMYLYGSFQIPFLFLSLLVIFERYVPKEIFQVKTEKILVCVFMILIGLYAGCQYEHIKDTNYKIVTSKGTLYVPFETGILLNNAVTYITYKTDKDTSILVLPEGNIINYLTERKVDLHCFMMDRLYFDTYGEINAKTLIKKTASDYIFLVDFGVYDFNRPYLYERFSNSVIKYIYDNYEQMKRYTFKYNANLIILKKKQDI